MSLYSSTTWPQQKSLLINLILYSFISLDDLASGCWRSHRLVSFTRVGRIETHWSMDGYLPLCWLTARDFSSQGSLDGNHFEGATGQASEVSHGPFPIHPTGVNGTSLWPLGVGLKKANWTSLKTRLVGDQLHVICCGEMAYGKHWVLARESTFLFYFIF